MYFLDSRRTLCHIIRDMKSGEAKCGNKDGKEHVINYRYGRPHGLLEEKPEDIPLCANCAKGTTSGRAI